jgi:SpoIID/LytB domain protein
VNTPSVNVGILTEQALSFVLHGQYVHTETSHYLSGEYYASLVGDKILFDGKWYEELFFEPASPAATFELKDVTIGIDFHWQRKENQRFVGALNLIAVKEGILAINEINVEDYLVSVISSEMSADAPKEFLKAHAVISRSWLSAQIEKNRHIRKEQPYQSVFRDDNRFIRWFDREDHELFDVCADDHCQRYQGVTRISNPFVKEAVEETDGEILTDGQEICDARFSKCCGGVTEKFEHCWEPAPRSYLTALRDNDSRDLPDLTIEEEAGKWIRTSPEAYCNVTDRNIISRVFNRYDRETTDFFRWRVEYSQAELSGLINRKGEWDFGAIADLKPVKRGASGRIEELEIRGTQKTLVIGKELEIRRMLSETHLYSSAFVVDKEEISEGIPGRFILTGAGWGHGVGLCQTGAAVMAFKGCTYKEILAHYYPSAFTEKRW